MGKNRITNTIRQSITILISAVLLLTAISCSSAGGGSTTTPNAATTSAPAVTAAPATAPAQQAATPEPAPEQTGPSYLNNDAIFPIVNEPITLTAMAGITNLQPEFGEIAAIKEYEEMTGIHIEWDSILTSELNEKRGLAFASNTLPDLFVKCNISAMDLLKYGTDGALVNIADYLDEYAPNFVGVMNTYPDIKLGQYEYDGSMYGMPNTLTDCEPVEVTRKMFVNKVWLDKLGLSLPTTTDELYEMLVAFKNGDGNGNGTADEVPWTSDGLAIVSQLTFGAFGLQNRGTGNGLLDVDPDTGEVRFFKTTESYKQWLEYINKLYTEGLLDQEIFTNKNTDVLALNEEKRVGVFGFANVSARARNEEDFIGITEALEGPNGDKMWSSVRPKILNKGAYAISSTNPYPEASIRWVDYFYSNEGARLVYLGVEGVSYEQTADGYDFKKEIKENIPEGSSFDAEVAKYAPYMGGGMPAQVSSEVFRGGEMAPIPAECAKALIAFGPKEIWPAFVYSFEESSIVSQVQTDINSYIDQSTAEFIQGVKPLSEFDAYVSQIEKMGLADFMEVNKAVVERMK